MNVISNSVPRNDKTKRLWGPHPMENHHARSRGGFPERRLQELLAMHAQHGSPEQHPSAATAVRWQLPQPARSCERNWMKQKRKKGEIIWGCLAVPAEFSEDICMSVGIQRSSPKRRFAESGGGQQLRLPKHPCSSPCLPVTLCCLECWPSRLCFGATPGAKFYLAWKIRARTRKWFALTEIT